MKSILKGVVAFLLLLYPVAIFFGISFFEPRFLTLFLLVVILVRFLSTTNVKFGAKGIERTLLIFSIILICIAFFNNSIIALKLYPVLINTSLLFVFLISLKFPPTAIERLARLKEPDLPPEGVSYTRKVTIVWSVFFSLNGLAALYTAMYTEIEIWTLYNGLISYILMGALFGSEWIYRRYYLKG